MWEPGTDWVGLKFWNRKGASIYFWYVERGGEEPRHMYEFQLWLTTFLPSWWQEVAGMLQRPGRWRLQGLLTLQFLDRRISPAPPECSQPLRNMTHQNLISTSPWQVSRPTSPLTNRELSLREGQQLCQCHTGVLVHQSGDANNSDFWVQIGGVKDVVVGG